MLGLYGLSVKLSTTEVIVYIVLHVSLVMYASCNMSASFKTGLRPPVKYFYRPFQGGTSFVDHLCFFCLVFVLSLCTSVNLCLVVTCWERADLLAFVCGVLL